MNKPDFTFKATDKTLQSVCRVSAQSALISLLLKSLHYKFSTEENILNDELRDMVWDADSNQTKILIVPSFQTAGGANEVDIFPRVVISGQGMQVQENTRPGLSTSSLTRDGIHKGVPRTVNIEGRLAINVTSSGEYESLLLGEEIFLWFLYLEPVIAEDLKLSKFDVTVLQGPSASEQYKDRYITTIGITWAAGITWRTVSEGPVFSDIKLN